MRVDTTICFASNQLHDLWQAVTFSKPQAHYICEVYVQMHHKDCVKTLQDDIGDLRVTRRGGMQKYC